MADDEQAEAGASAASEQVTVEVNPPQRIAVVCGECGAAVDTVEYDDEPEGPSAAVRSVASLLGVDDDEAAKLVKRHNPAALKTSRERAEDLARQIAARKVPDRGTDTYVCRNGHDGPLEVEQ